MSYRVRVSFQDTNEEIELVEEPYNNNGALLYFYHDANGNYLKSHLKPFHNYPAHSISKGMGAVLGSRPVIVIGKDEV